MPMDQAEFDHAREMLRQSIVTLNGAFVNAFPDGFIYDPDAYKFDPNPLVTRMTGTAGDHPMHSIAAKIYDVLETFDRMQEKLGLPPGEEPRFLRFRRGDCNQ